MAVDPLSRYAGAAVHTRITRDGREAIGLAARFPPPDAPAVIGRRHLAVRGDTYESLSAEYYGSSRYWWRIADANPQGFPLAPEPGTLVLIPEDAAAGRVERRRVI